jgi:predicted lipoprotein with Yx(FWY)xxD motif
MTASAMDTPVTLTLTLGELAALIDGTPSVYNALQTHEARLACRDRRASDWEPLTAKLAEALDHTAPYLRAVA